MSRPVNPSFVVPTWATDTSYPAGASVWSSQPTKVTFGAPAGGFVPGAPAAAPYFNKLFFDAFTTDAAGKTANQATLDFAGQIQALNFRQPGIAQSFVHGVWNPSARAWYAIETTTNCKASFSAGYTWGSNVITGADTLHRIGSDPSGNLVITTAVTSGTIHEFNGTTWTRRTASVFGGGSFLSIVGKVQIAYDTTSSTWWMGALNTSPAQIVCATSTDRVTWTARSVPTSGTETSLEVVAGNGLLVMIGRMATGGISHVWTSANGGVSWAARADITHGFTAGTVDQIVYSATEGLFMAVFGNVATPACKVVTSPDGVTWTARGASVTKCISKLANLGAMWVAHMSNQEVAFSLDSGATWKGAGMVLDTPAAMLASPGQILGLCASTVFPGLIAGPGFSTVF